MRYVSALGLVLALLLPGCYLGHGWGDEVPSDGVSPPSSDRGPTSDPTSTTSDPTSDGTSGPTSSGVPEPDTCAFVDVAGGFNRGVAALHADGSVWGWAWEEPVRRIEGLVDVVQMDAHDKYVCGVHESGAVSCGLLFDDYASLELTQGPVPEIEDAVSVTVGEFHACAVLADGRVACWGYNYEGVLGIEADWEIYPEPVMVPGITDAVQLATARDHTCALLADGSVTCWGYLTGATEAPPDLPPLRELVMGDEHACGIARDGGVRCWGSNVYGQRGDASLARLDAVHLVAGTSHTCARLASDEVLCWGSNEAGELGRDGGSSSSPVPLPGAVRAIAVTAGHHGTCLLDPTCEVRCFGWAPSRSLSGK